MNDGALAAAVGSVTPAPPRAVAQTCSHATRSCHGTAGAGANGRHPRRPTPSSMQFTAVPPRRLTSTRTGSRRRLGAVLLVGDVLAPGDGTAAVVGLLHRDMDHEAVWGGAVPVVLGGLEEHAVARADDLDRVAFALAQAYALGHEDRLPERMGVPRGPGARREVHARRAEAGGLGGGGDGVDVDVAGEPVGRAFHRVDAAAGDLHVVFRRSRLSAVSARRG